MFMGVYLYHIVRLSSSGVGPFLIERRAPNQQWLLSKDSRPLWNTEGRITKLSKNNHMFIEPTEEFSTSQSSFH